MVSKNWTRRRKSYHLFSWPVVKVAKKSSLLLKTWFHFLWGRITYHFTYDPLLCHLIFMEFKWPLVVLYTNKLRTHFVTYWEEDDKLLIDQLCSNFTKIFLILIKRYFGKLISIFSKSIYYYIENYYIVIAHNAQNTQQNFVP